MPLLARRSLCRALVAVAMLLPCALAPGGARAACAGFGAAATYAAGTSPQMAAAGDFDGDGIPDLAVACLAGAPLEILRGTGGGAFAAPVAYTSGSGGRALVVSDFNGDGHADIAECVGNNVAIWLGTGTGTFGAGALFAAGASGSGIVAADFDGDGIVDLAVAGNGNDKVVVMRGNGADGIGDGTFGAPVAYAVGAAPARILAADLDGDGILDLATANNAGASVTVLRGNGANGAGDGTFTLVGSTAVTGSPWGLAALDWNGDGRLDLVVSDGAGTIVTLLRGTGACAFASAGTVTVATAPRDLVAGDFDGDGVADVAVACAASNVVALLHGTGAGFTLLGKFAAGSGAQGLAAADWNGDGAPDVASVNAGNSSISRLAGACTAATTAQVALLAPLGHDAWWPGTRPRVNWTRGAGVTAVDVDLSRDSGVTWTPLARGVGATSITVPATGPAGDHLRVRVRDAIVASRAAASTADFTLCAVLGGAVASDAGLAASALAVADVDADGDPDLAATDGAQVAILRGDGTGHFARIAAWAAAGTTRLRFADANGDGIPDLLRLSSAGVGIRLGDGRGAFGPESTLAVAGGTGFVAADFDGDGLLDVAALGTGAAGARLTVWNGAGGTPWTLDLTGAPGPLAVADLDGDGITDLVAGAGANVIELQGNGAAARGDGTFRAGPPSALASAPGEFAIGDLDGAGATAVLATLPASGDLVRIDAATLAGTSVSGATSSPNIVAAAVAARAPLIADLDGDGHADVVATLAADASVGVLRGTGAGLAAALRFAAGRAGAALAVDDFTRDGNPDVVVAASGNQVVCLATPCPPQLPAMLALDAAADTTAACAGFARTISWTRSGAIAAVRIELSRDGGAHWSTLADGVTAKSWTWIASGPETGAARLRVRDAACGTRRDATPPFAVRAPFGAAAANAAPPARLAATADLDGDGRAGAVVADDTGITVLRGDGAGGFAPVLRWDEPGVRRVRIADIDADGLPDVIALHATSVTVRRGSAGGGFGAASTVAVDGSATDLAIGDFDEDGRPDLAIASAPGIGSRIVIWRGLGADASGTVAFARGLAYALPAAPAAIATADMDGDGILDLVTAHAGGIAVLRGLGASGHGDGTFKLASNRAFGSNSARALLVTDLDGDGRPDVAAADSALGAVLVAAGDGLCGLAAAAAVPVAGSPAAVVAADLDRDGATDLVACTRGGDAVVLRGLAGAALASRFVRGARIALGGAAAWCAFTDADGDSVPDLLALDPAGALRVAHGGARRVPAPQLLPFVSGSATAGAEFPLAWTRPAGTVAVNVELSRDAGAHWCTLASDVAGTTWRWTATGPYTACAQLRVRDAATPGRAGAPAAIAIDPSLAGAPLPAPAPDAGVRLGMPWPNPGPGPMSLELTLPSPARTVAEVWDVDGRRVRVLGDAPFAAGTHTLRWDGADEAGRPAPPGLYFIRVQAGTFSTVRRAVVRP